MRPIDADALIGKFERDVDYYGPWIREEIIDSPTIEAEPVRHGHWEIHTDAVGNTYYECSCCHTTWWEIKSNDNYCSACGAKMDEASL